MQHKVVKTNIVQRTGYPIKRAVEILIGNSYEYPENIIPNANFAFELKNELSDKIDIVKDELEKKIAAGGGSSSDHIYQVINETFIIKNNG